MTTQDQIFVIRHSIKTRRIKTTHFGTESLSFLGPKIWDQVPQELKNIEVVANF